MSEHVRADATFSIVPEWVLYADISANAVRLYATLRRYADKEGGAYPSRRRLAGHMHCSLDTIDRCVKELVALGAIEVTPRQADGGQTSNSYLIRSLRPPSRADAAGSEQESGGPLGTGAAPMNENHVNENQLTRAPTELPEPQESTGAIVSTAPRRRDEIFEALYAVWLNKPYVTGSDGLTKTARGQLNRAASELRGAGATPAEIMQLPDAWVALWPGREKPTFTPAAAAKHWPALIVQLRSGYVARGGSEADDLRRALERTA